jgi:hypothetical protein
VVLVFLSAYDDERDAAEKCERATDEHGDRQGSGVLFFEDAFSSSGLEALLLLLASMEHASRDETSGSDSDSHGSADDERRARLGASLLVGLGRKFGAPRFSGGFDGLSGEKRDGFVEPLEGALDQFGFAFLIAEGDDGLTDAFAINKNFDVCAVVGNSRGGAWLLGQRANVKDHHGLSVLANRDARELKRVPSALLKSGLDPPHAIGLYATKVRLDRYGLCARGFPRLGGGGERGGCEQGG